MQWVRRYIYLHGKRHPAGMGKAEGAFLTTLAVERNAKPRVRSCNTISSSPCCTIVQPHPTAHVQPVHPIGLEVAAVVPTVSARGDVIQTADEVYSQWA